VKDEDTGSLACPSPSFKTNSFLPFGHGTRSCPGRIYSEVLSFVFLGTVLQNFEWTLADGMDPKARFVPDVMLIPEGGTRISVKKRVSDGGGSSSN